MLKWGYVPDDFGEGILIPLMKDKNGDASSFDNFRGITISCAISKLFEYAVIVKYSALFVTDNLQFGFKNGIGCNDALFTVKSTIDYFLNSGATVTVTALDISKAFDRISYYALFSKLMKRQFPKPLIKVLLSWYTMCSVKVKWDGMFSEEFQPSAGVRQGGVLSPMLFAIYMEDIFSLLRSRNKGCFIGNVFLGCFLYADDILLISQSVSCMQDMLNICHEFFKSIDLEISSTKSSALRIGRRCSIKCSNLLIGGQIIPWVDQLKYLGITMMKGLTVKRSFCLSKIKLYKCFNAIYSKASYASEEVVVNLFKSYCLPIMTYACEAVYPSKKDIKSMNRIIDVIFYHIFHTYDCDMIYVLRDFCGLGDVDTLLNARRMNFTARF